MGLMSPSASVTRYRVEGKPLSPVLETLRKGLTAFAVKEIDAGPADRTSGWTAFNHPYLPVFDDDSWVQDPFLVFSLRVDRKVLSSRVLQKHLQLAAQEKAAELKIPFLSRKEKDLLQDQVKTTLQRRIPSTPRVFDIVWNLEAGSLFFFSNLRSANEELDALFSKSFGPTLVRLFPYTLAAFMSGLSPRQQDRMLKLSPAKFTEEDARPGHRL